ncbi:PaeR7I family type II restriction endonuclease [Cohnella yongneupensis]|uniref:PaeR7I family type II restriction endonuclease n=1 Tax=Cohnella yongneupensis TaxID=425006 RepID=A0ABW0R3Z5_9BACL
MWMPTDDEIKDMTKVALETFWGLRHLGDKGVRGGKTMDGFAEMLQGVLRRCGVDDTEIIMGKKAKLPSFYRLSKDWDMIVIQNRPDGSRRLLCVLEFKSMKGSVGKNLNNRVEEAVGSSADLWKAYENDAFGVTRPFLGYIYVMSEDIELIIGNTERKGLLFPPLEAFTKFERTGRPANYEERAELFMKHMAQEHLYDKCAFIIADPDIIGEYRQPNLDLTIELLIKTMVGHVQAHQ